MPGNGSPRARGGAWGVTGPILPFHGRAHSSVSWTLTKARFVSYVRAALERAGIPCRLYSGHSFRIGAATGFHYPSVGEVVQHGILSYIRTPPAHLAQLSRTLAGAGGSR